MVKHIVCWTFAKTDGVSTADNVARIAEELNGLPALIPGIVTFEVVRPQPGLESSFDLALYSEFESPEALANYVVHPEHQAVAKLIGSLRRERWALDYDPAQLS